MAQSCPACGYTPDEGETITLHKCGYCGKVVKHTGGSQACTSFIDCIPGRRQNHYNLQKAGTITGVKKK